MKNKKLLKTVLCIASGIGFATSIPFMTTACGSSSTKTSILPDEVYKYDPNDSTILTGFTDEFLADTAKYGQYDTMEIPASVTSIAEQAFAPGFASIIPSFIKNLTFADGSKCASIKSGAFYSSHILTSIFPNGLTTIENGAFNSSDLISAKIPSTLTEIGVNVFSYSYNLSSIVWDAWQGGTTTSVKPSFDNVSAKGTVKVTNPTSGNDSQKLLDYLKENGSLPSGWTIS